MVGKDWQTGKTVDLKQKQKVRIIYEDDMYPGKNKKYIEKTIGEILETHNDPNSFITRFNSANGNMCLSDEISVNRRHVGSFNRGWERN